MADFKRRRGESASQWCARLGATNMSALTPHQLEELTLRRVLADQAARRENRRRRAGAEANDSNGHESEELCRCKDLARALSLDDRRRLMQWVETNLAE
jgi:hypothetical protein